MYLQKKFKVHNIHLTNSKHKSIMLLYALKPNFFTMFKVGGGESLFRFFCLLIYASVILH